MAFETTSEVRWGEERLHLDQRRTTADEEDR